MDNKENTKPLMKVDEVARYLNVSKHTIYAWVHARQIPFEKMGNKPRALVRFDLDEINRWRKKNTKAVKLIKEFREE